MQKTERRGKAEGWLSSYSLRGIPHTKQSGSLTILSWGVVLSSVALLKTTAARLNSFDGKSTKINPDVMNVGKRGI